MTILIIFLTIEWKDIALGLFGSTTIGSVVLFFLNAHRFRRKDTAEADKTEAEVKKTKAEAFETNAKAESLLVDSSLKLVLRLGEECDMTKKELQKVQKDLEALLLVVKEYKERNEALLARNESLVIEIQHLTEEIGKLKGTK